MPFQNRRFDSDFLTVKKVIEQGYLGDLVDITVNMDHFRPNDASQGGNFDGADIAELPGTVHLYGEPPQIIQPGDQISFYPNCH